MSGPPVILFPSLAGSVLECHESPVENYVGKRVWMRLGALMDPSKAYELKITDDTGSTTASSSPFVQHLVLDPSNPGKDIPGFKVSTNNSPSAQNTVSLWWQTRETVVR